MKRNILSILMLGFLFLIASCEGKKDKDSAEIAEDQNEAKHEDDGLEKDSEKAVEIADGGMFEVQMATSALTKAKSPEVKRYAQMMVDDHTKANNELKAWAGKKGVKLPDVMSEDMQKKYYDIERDSKDFDKDYIDEMVDDHKKDIDKFEKVAKDANDQEFKTWAANTLGTLRHHLEEAERIQDALKNKK
jgi:putative membrane protein